MFQLFDLVASRWECDSIGNVSTRKSKIFQMLWGKSEDNLICML